MPARQTHLPPANYKTFGELAGYARQRARISAKRRGHQEFAYWCSVFEWSLQGERLNCDPVQEFEMHRQALAHDKGWKPSTCSLSTYASVTADFYWKVVHLRRMLINRGENPPRLSLKWLREAAERL